MLVNSFSTKEFGLVESYCSCNAINLKVKYYIFQFQIPVKFFLHLYKHWAVVMHIYVNDNQKQIARLS